MVQAVDQGLLHPVDFARVEQASEVAVGGQAFHGFLLAELVSGVRGHVSNGQVESRGQPVERLGEWFQATPHVLSCLVFQIPRPAQLWRVFPVAVGVGA